MAVPRTLSLVSTGFSEKPVPQVTDQADLRMVLMPRPVRQVSGSGPRNQTRIFTHCKTGRGLLMKSRQSGFTLIELVVVITIIAILAAAALPRFASLQADARMAKMNGALGAVKSAAGMAHAQLLTRAFSPGATVTAAASGITMEGAQVGYVNGYPDAASIAPIAGVAAPDFAAPTVAGTVVTFAPDANHNGTGGNPACTFTYTQAAAGVQPTYNVTNLTLANCQ
jgi:MSHA pilin protein MshA